MKINVDELYKKDRNIYRVLIPEKTKVLLIDCIKKTMPRWEDISFLEGYEKISEEQFRECVGIEIPKYEEFTPIQKKEAHKKYSSISLILNFLKTDYERNAIINICCGKLKLSKVTLKKRLIQYLVFQDIGIFIKQNKPKELTQDQKNYRAVLNRYYYNGLGLPLIHCYHKLLEEKYSENGILLSKRPSYRQFYYYFRLHNKKSNEIISREGKGKYNRDYRPRLGEGVKAFSPAVGYGMVDSTILDIFVLENENPVRPVLTLCVDSYSSLILGYSLGYSNNTDSLVSLMLNVVSNKKEHCNKFGISIDNEQWPSFGLPHFIITDRGREYLSQRFSNTTELGVEIINLESYSPHLKGPVEVAFHSIQNSFRSELAISGVIFKDFQERGGKDYRKNATLSLLEIEKVILHSIIRYNAKRIVNLPLELCGKVEPFANSLFLYNSNINKNNFIFVDKDTLVKTLLPRTTGTFQRNGLKVGKLLYRNPNYTQMYLTGGTCTVAYEPENCSFVYLLEKGIFVKFEIKDKFLMDVPVEKANEFLMKKGHIERQFEGKEIQGRIDMSKEIEMIRKANKLLKR